MPLVKISTARSSGCRSTTGAGSCGDQVVDRDGARRSRRSWLATTISRVGTAVRSSIPITPLAVGPGDHGLGADGGQLALDLRDRAGRVQRHRHQPGAEHREVGDDEVPVVGGDDADAVARLEPERGQAAPQTRHLAPQVAVGCGLAAGDHRHRGVGVWVDDRRQVHSRQSSTGRSGRLTAGCGRRSRLSRFVPIMTWRCPLVSRRAPAGGGSRSSLVAAVLAGWGVAGASQAQAGHRRPRRQSPRRSPPIRAPRRSS